MSNGEHYDMPLKEEVVTNRQANLVKLLEAADSATNRNYLIQCAESRVRVLNDSVLDSGLTKSLEQMNLFKVSRLVYGAGENPAEKLKTFFLAFSGLGLKASIFYIIQNELVRYGQAEDGSDNEYAASLYLGVKPLGMDHSAREAQAACELFKEAFRGTFLGSEISEELPKEDVGDANVVSIESLRKKATREADVDIVCVSAQPSVRKDSDDKTVEQGLEHFIDVMRNREYTAVILASPVDQATVELRKREIENFYSKLSLYQKVTVAFGENDSRAIGQNLSESTTVTTTNGESLTKTDSQSATTSESTGRTVGTSSSYGSNGSSSGSSSSESLTWGRSETIGFSMSQGTTHSISDAKGQTSGTSDTRTSGSSVTNTVEVQNKGIVDLLARLDESLKKIRKAETYGLWECAAYFISQRVTEAACAAYTFKSLVLGEESEGERCHIIHWPLPTKPEERVRQQNLLSFILSGEHPVLDTNDPVYRRIIPTSLVNGRDLAYFMCLPHKSVPGLPVDTIAAFERSVAIKGGSVKGEHSVMIDFGRICHMDKLESPVELDLNDFTKHCFITGSTGSGKSNTTELLLQRCIEKKVNFLVVEPAKGEYKKSFKNVRNINIFTTHPLCETLLHINPFKFNKAIHVLEHIDRLLGIFSSCWELTAAMPAILKKGVEQAYRSVGWDLANSYYIGDSTEPRYPTFATLTGELQKVIENSGYSAEAKGNYTGALVTRVESLTAGVLKQIFCNEYDIPASVLFDGRTIVDLSRLGSAETKTLIMGVMVMQLSEYRQVTVVKTNSGIKHVTVIEEAHNLLRNLDGGIGGSDLIRKSVEMMSNAIAEMRTYGEGFMIVDQSPTAVDISAIKNTNTKIVMRLPEQHDCEAVANAMGLDEFQTKEIAKLPPGVAVVMQNSWTSAVLTRVHRSEPSSGIEEWTDPAYNRELRTKLALICGDIGNRLGRFWAEARGRHDADPPSLPSRDFLKEIIVAEVAKNYSKFVGEGRLRELIEKYGTDVQKYPIPARAKELVVLIDYYYDRYGLNPDKPMADAYTSYGMLIIALLGCGECWRTFLDQGALHRHVDTFCNLISKYVVLRSDKDFNRQFASLAICVRCAFLKKYIKLSGGSSSDTELFKSCAYRKNPTAKIAMIALEKG